jgi:hypothetical protein
VADGLPDVPLILNATLRDDFAKAFVAAHISKYGLPDLVNEGREAQRYNCITHAFRLADDMLLAREGRLPKPRK